MLTLAQASKILRQEGLHIKEYELFSSSGIHSLLQAVAIDILLQVILSFLGHTWTQTLRAQRRQRVLEYNKNKLQGTQ